MTRDEEIRNAIDTIIPILPSNNGRTYEQALMAAGFEYGVSWADKNPHSQYIAEYLYKEKGYPISLNGEIPTFEETIKDVQTYNDYKAKQWLEKACKWLLKGEYFVNNTETIDDFKRAMEED